LTTESLRRLDSAQVSHDPRLEITRVADAGRHSDCGGAYATRFRLRAGPRSPACAVKRLATGAKRGQVKA